MLPGPETRNMRHLRHVHIVHVVRYIYDHFVSDLSIFFIAWHASSRYLEHISSLKPTRGQMGGKVIFPVLGR